MSTATHAPAWRPTAELPSTEALTAALDAALVLLFVVVTTPIILANDAIILAGRLPQLSAAAARELTCRLGRWLFPHIASTCAAARWVYREREQLTEGAFAWLLAVLGTAMLFAAGYGCVRLALHFPAALHLAGMVVLLTAAVPAMLAVAWCFAQGTSLVAHGVRWLVLPLPEAADRRVMALAGLGVLAGGVVAAYLTPLVATLIAAYWVYMVIGLGVAALALVAIIDPAGYGRQAREYAAARRALPTLSAFDTAPVAADQAAEHPLAYAVLSIVTGGPTEVLCQETAGLTAADATEPETDDDEDENDDEMEWVFAPIGYLARQSNPNRNPTGQRRSTPRHRPAHLSPARRQALRERFAMLQGGVA